MVSDAGQATAEATNRASLRSLPCAVLHVSLLALRSTILSQLLQSMMIVVRQLFCHMPKRSAQRMQLGAQVTLMGWDRLQCVCYFYAEHTVFRGRICFGWKVSLTFSKISMDLLRQHLFLVPSRILKELRGLHTRGRAGRQVCQFMARASDRRKAFPVLSQSLPCQLAVAISCPLSGRALA
eukprot:986671-Amphidinium_carterae.1